MAIRLLDDATINRIAAGEVVERPASVVKELIENSLDAGARRIEVTIGDGVIIVRDDGCGMSPSDLDLAVQRHATSKITKADDLATIRSYGFRGEALPSIASVSELELRSRRAGDEVGTYLRLQAGEVQSRGAAAVAPGTQVTVRKLFFNTPVRGKFLRSERTETGRAVVAVEHLALARHDVAFRCEINGKLVLSTPGTGQPIETIIAVYGVDDARHVLVGHAGEYKGGNGEVLALVGGPATARSDRRRQCVFVNGRPVWARGVLEVAAGAYPWGLLPGRKHPLLLVYLDLPAAEVDANVHPAKAEVRLSGESRVYALVVNAVRAAAHGSSDDPAWGTPDAQAGNGDQGRQAAWDQVAVARDGLVQRNAPSAADWPAHGPPPVWAGAGQILRDGPVGWLPSAPPAPALRIDALSPLGQAGGRWVVCDGPGGVYLVDQHAAHERVQFERLGRVRAEAHGMQGLAIPAPVDLAPTDLVAWREHQSELSALGLETEHFGGATVLIRALPAELAVPGFVPGAFLQDVLATLAADGPSPALAPHLRARRAVASCAASVKASTPLSAAEVGALLRDLATCSEPLKCPHGRPTVILLSHEELGRRFGRS